MSLYSVTMFSLLRCLLLVMLIIPVGHYFSRFLSRSKGREKKWLWALLCYPIFVPELLAGYSYANFSLNLVQWPWMNELFYFLLLFIKVLPVAVLVFYLSPPPLMSESAIYCEKLKEGKLGFVGKSRILLDFKISLKGYITQILFVFAVTFLYAFQEFQVASLLGVTFQSWHYPASWTVWLFDAQASGMLPSETLSRMLFPLLCEIVIVIPLIIVTAKISKQPLRHQSVTRPVSIRAKKWILFYSVFSLICFVLIPFVVIGNEMLTGWKTIFQTSKYFKEILTGFSLSLIVAFLTVFMSMKISTKIVRFKSILLSSFFLLVIMLPGFVGALILSLCLFDLFQNLFLSQMSDTLIPYLFGMSLYLVPRVLILQILYLIRVKKEPYALLNLLDKKKNGANRFQIWDLKWHLKYHRQFWLVCLAVMWSYWDLTLSSILLPARYSTATVRLYNLMHYGRSETLSAMLVLAIIIPVFIVILFYYLRKPMMRILNTYA